MNSFRRRFLFLAISEAQPKNSAQNASNLTYHNCELEVLTEGLRFRRLSDSCQRRLAQGNPGDRLYVGIRCKLLITQHREIGKIFLDQLPHLSPNVHRCQ